MFFTSLLEPKNLEQAVTDRPLIVTPNTLVSDGLLFPIDIVTERDIVQFQALNLDFERIQAQEVMSISVFSIHPDDSLSLALVLMQEKRINPVVVTGELGQLLGIVTQTTLFKALNPVEIYKLVETLEQKVSRLEAEKVELLQQRNAELEEQVQKRTTELQAQSEALCQSEQLYASLAAAAPVGIFRTNVLGDCTYVNDRWCEIAGLTSVEAMGTGWVQALHPDDQKRVFEEWNRFVEEQVPFGVEYRFQRSDGKITWVFGQTEIERGVDGKITGYIGTITDITEGKQAQMDLQSLVEGAAALTDQDLFPAIAKYIATALSVSYVLISQRKGNFLSTHVFWAHGKLQSNFSLPLDNAPCGRAMAEGMFWCAEGVQEKFPQNQLLHDLEIESYLGTALTNIQGEAIGSLCILDEKQIHDIPRIAKIIKIFAARISAELERQEAMAALHQLNVELEARVEQRTTALRESEERLRKSEMHLRNALRIAHLGSWEFELQTQQISWSTEVFRIFGRNIEDGPPTYEQLHQFIHPDDRERHERIVSEAIRSGQSYEIEFRLYRPDSTLRYLQGRGEPIFNTEGQLIRFIGTALDITERKQAEEQLRQANERLNQANAKLHQATRLKDEFLANMSHELRTPLNAILGMSEGLLEQVFGSLNDRQKQAITTIEKSGQHLLELINDILDLSKIESGKLELHTARVSVKCLCESSLTFVRQQATKKNLHLFLEIPPGLPKIVVDERRIRQVLINLLNNAVKFTPNGGSVKLVAQLEQHQETDFLCFSVIDTGIGIPQEEIGKLFQPFVQIDSSLNRQHSGTGLGLALVRRLVEMHGGAVTLSTELGRGSCFTVRLPYTHKSNSDIAPTSLVKPINRKTLPNTIEKLQYPEQFPTTALVFTPRFTPIEATASPLILIVEDNEANLTTIASYLGARGYRLIIGKDGQQAVTLTKEQKPDLILMDIQMPGMDGLEAMRQIRLLPEFILTPIIALTALAMPGDREKCMAAGASEYLIKPVKLKLLLEKIKHSLNNNPNNNSNAQGRNFSTNTNYR
jgi:PAS domain S-box-containing protein